jgi:UDP-3-O-[3-hydroxymyristoyl] N-acetylglucosamine deacetylase
VFSWPSNYDSCYTLSGVITKEGVGLHSGEKTRVKISPFEKEGYYVSFSDKPDEIFKLNQDLIGKYYVMYCSQISGKKFIYN